jgi:hypothetical protein
MFMLLRLFYLRVLQAHGLKLEEGGRFSFSLSRFILASDDVRSAAVGHVSLKNSPAIHACLAHADVNLL